MRARTRCERTPTIKKMNSNVTRNSSLWKKMSWFWPRSWYRPRCRFQTPPQGFQPWNPAEALPPYLRWERRSQTHAREPAPWTHIFVRCALFSGGRYHDRGPGFLHSTKLGYSRSFEGFGASFPVFRRFTGGFWILFRGHDSLWPSWGLD